MGTDMRSEIRDVRPVWSSSLPLRGVWHAVPTSVHVNIDINHDGEGFAAMPGTGARCGAGILRPGPAMDGMGSGFQP
jgi:hypothetical protein